jgi:hypothetical protein
MKNETDKKMQAELEALSRFLEIHGADRSRWPARERLKFSSLLAENVEARRLLSEAEELDRLLDAAPVTESDNIAALKDRIIEAALAEPPGAVPAAAPRPARGLRPRPARRPELLNLPAAALLAASLVLGVFAGASGLVDVSPESADVAAGSDGESETDAGRLALGGDDAPLVEEELL